MQLKDQAAIVTGGASAVYGSDAVAGVVNFILKRDFEGLRLRGQADISQRGDAGIAGVAQKIDAIAIRARHEIGFRTRRQRQLQQLRQGDFARLDPGGPRLRRPHPRRPLRRTGADGRRTGASADRPRAAGPAPAAVPQQPIVLSRNGKDFKITANQSTVRAGTEIRVKTERPEVAISLTEMAKDSWVVFELPGFANATSGKQQDSIDALRKATETSYFKGPDAVWVKLVIPTAPKGIGMDQFGPSVTQTSITVRR